MPDLPARPNMPRELVKQIADDIGKEAVSHLRVSYPEAFAALGPSGQLSLRNTIFNQIMAAIEVTDAGAITARLAERARHRRRVHKAFADLRGEPNA